MPEPPRYAHSRYHSCDQFAKFWNLGNKYRWLALMITVFYSEVKVFLTTTNSAIIYLYDT